MNMSAQMTYNRLELLKLMYLSREGDRREGVLHRQSNGWFQVAGMGHEPLAAIAQQLNDGDYLFPYYRDRAMVLARGVSNAELASAYFAKKGSSSGGGACDASVETKSFLSGLNDENSALMSEINEDVKALDVSEVSSFTDVMIVASGGSTRQVKALANKVAEAAP